MTKGYLMLAIGKDYVEQSCLCAMSLKLTQKINNVSLVTNDPVPKKYQPLFDNIIELPWVESTDFYATEHRWKLYHVTPYDETVVIDTDMLFLNDISNWWEYLKDYELCFATNVTTYRNELVNSHYYREAFEVNNLPNLYSGFHYFKKKDLALDFYKWLELIAFNRELFYGRFVPKKYPKQASMDISCSIVAKIMQIDDKITTNANYPRFVHMKGHVQNWNEPVTLWRNKVDAYITDDLELIVGGYKQQEIFHYTDNEFVTPAILNKYEKRYHEFCNI